MSPIKSSDHDQLLDQFLVPFVPGSDPTPEPSFDTTGTISEDTEFSVPYVEGLEEQPVIPKTEKRSTAELVQMPAESATPTLKQVLRMIGKAEKTYGKDHPITRKYVGYAADLESLKDPGILNPVDLLVGFGSAGLFKQAGRGAYRWAAPKVGHLPIGAYKAARLKVPVKRSLFKPSPDDVFIPKMKVSIGDRLRFGISFWTWGLSDITTYSGKLLYRAGVSGTRNARKLIPDPKKFHDVSANATRSFVSSMFGEKTTSQIYKNLSKNAPPLPSGDDVVKILGEMVGQEGHKRQGYYNFLKAVLRDVRKHPKSGMDVAGPASLVGASVEILRQLGEEEFHPEQIAIASALAAIGWPIAKAGLMSLKNITNIARETGRIPTMARKFMVHGGTPDDLQDIKIDFSHGSQKASDRATEVNQLGKSHTMVERFRMGQILRNSILIRRDPLLRDALNKPDPIEYLNQYARHINKKARKEARRRLSPGEELERPTTQRPYRKPKDARRRSRSFPYHSRKGGAFRDIDPAVTHEVNQEFKALISRRKALMEGSPLKRKQLLEEFNKTDDTFRKMEINDELRALSSRSPMPEQTGLIPGMRPEYRYPKLVASETGESLAKIENAQLKLQSALNKMTEDLKKEGLLDVEAVARVEKEFGAYFPRVMDHTGDIYPYHFGGGIGGKPSKMARQLTAFRTMRSGESRPFLSGQQFKTASMMQRGDFFEISIPTPKEGVKHYVFDDFIRNPATGEISRVQKNIPIYPASDAELLSGIWRNTSLENISSNRDSLDYLLNKVRVTRSPLRTGKKIDVEHIELINLQHPDPLKRIGGGLTKRTIKRDYDWVLPDDQVLLEKQKGNLRISIRDSKGKLVEKPYVIGRDQEIPRIWKDDKGITWIEIKDGNGNLRKRSVPKDHNALLYVKDDIRQLQTKRRRFGKIDMKRPYTLAPKDPEYGVLSNRWVRNDVLKRVDSEIKKNIQRASAKGNETALESGYKIYESTVPARRGTRKGSPGSPQRDYIIARDIPAAARMQMGEVFEGFQPVSRTLYENYMTIELNKFIKRIISNKEWVIPYPQTKSGFPQAAEFPEVPVGYTQFGTGQPKKGRFDLGSLKAGSGKADLYSELQGRIVRNDILGELMEMEKIMNHRVGVVDRLLSGWKFNMVPLNPTAIMRNIYSNVILADLGGLSPFTRHGINVYTRTAQEFAESSLMPSGHTLGVKSAFRSIPKGEVKDLGKYIKEAQSNQAQGFLGSSFSKQEMRIVGSAFLRSKGDDSIIKLLDGVAETAAKVGKKLKISPGGIYESIETFNKLALFIDGRMTGLTIKQAANHARKYGIDYQHVSSAVNTLRKGWGGIFGVPFVTFTSKALPLFMETLIKHPIRAAKWPLALMGVSETSRRFLDITPEDAKSERELAELNPLRWMRLPWKDQYGNSTFLDWGYIFPFGDLMAGWDLMRGRRDANVGFLPFFNSPFITALEAVTNYSYFKGGAKDIFAGEPGKMPSTLSEAGSRALGIAGVALPRMTPFIGSGYKSLMGGLYSEKHPYTLQEKSALAAISQNLLGLKTKSPVLWNEYQLRKRSLDKRLDNLMRKSYRITNDPNISFGQSRSMLNSVYGELGDLHEDMGALNSLMGINPE